MNYTSYDFGINVNCPWFALGYQEIVRKRNGISKLRHLVECQITRKNSYFSISPHCYANVCEWNTTLRVDILLFALLTCVVRGDMDVSGERNNRILSSFT